MHCAANIRNFSQKFAARCIFLSFLGNFCSALHFQSHMNYPAAPDSTESDSYFQQEADLYPFLPHQAFRKNGIRLRVNYSIINKEHLHPHT